MAASGPEAKFQSSVIKYLRSKGCIVYKMQQNATTRIATPDVLFLKEGFWGAIECKASARAKFQPGQKEMVAKLNDWSYAQVAYPGNWDEIKKELDVILG